MITLGLLLLGAAQAAYPGPEYLHPKIHYSSEALHRGGWHDIAGAITLGSGKDTVHHIFQGCGWNHAMSNDLVHWTDMGIGPKTIHEQHAGLDSHSTPCSGYVTVDDADGQVCAGFRQCGSKKGVVGGANWDVPLELRCAKDKNLTEWSDPIWLFDVFFYRGIPYDPARPWKEDGRWYQIISTDACNDTTRHSPCDEGGRLDLWSSPVLKTTEWKYHGHMFTSNKTVVPSGHLTKEMVTIDYLGNMPGDPDGPTGDNRYFFNNVGGNGGGVGCCSGTTAYFKGKQRKSDPFKVDYSDPDSMGMVDWGSFTPLPGTAVKGAPGLSGTASRAYSMARTLGGDVNQVTGGGRRIMFAWLGGTPASMSVGRDLSVNKDLQLLQQFVPEMKILRLHETDAPTSQQIEVIAKFTVPGGAELPPSPSPSKLGWKQVVSKGPIYGELDVGSEAFTKALAASPTKIVKRLCSTCSGTHREIYYKRLTPVSADVDLFGVLKSNWTDYNNVLHTDFELYSDYDAAVTGQAAGSWQYCNFNDASGVGAFRDCGPTKAVQNQWNSFSGRGGQDSVAFYVDATGSHPPPTPPELLPFGVEVLKGSNGEGTRIGVDPLRGLVTVNGTTQGNHDVRAGPLMPFNATEVTIHAIIDHSIIEVIVNNRTALTVYVTPSSTSSVGLALYGAGKDGTNVGKVTGSVQAWELATANNVDVNAQEIALV